jgi:UPF0042 nucleotide-binding protein
LAVKERQRRQLSHGGRDAADERHLVIITGLSGSGKGSVLKAFEDTGYYCVDNLPVDLLPKFAELLQQSSEITRGALVIDIREGGQRLENLPHIVRELRRSDLRVTLVFLEASDEVIMRRFSETRRPHPLVGDNKTLQQGIDDERGTLSQIRATADIVIDTSKFNVRELRSFITDRIIRADGDRSLQISVTSFGFRNGVPQDSDLVFDVRFLPNPNYIPEFRARTGHDPEVAKYIRSFPQTREFIKRISALLKYLIPHYKDEGKTYLTISFGCTGGQHRSVMIAEAIQRELQQAGYRAKILHRDMPH